MSAFVLFNKSQSVSHVAFLLFALSFSLKKRGGVIIIYTMSLSLPLVSKFGLSGA